MLLLQILVVRIGLLSLYLLLLLHGSLMLRGLDPLQKLYRKIASRVRRLDVGAALWIDVMLILLRHFHDILLSQMVENGCVEAIGRAVRAGHVPGCRRAPSSRWRSLLGQRLLSLYHLHLSLLLGCVQLRCLLGRELAALLGVHLQLLDLIEDASGGEGALRTILAALPRVLVLVIDVQ